MYATRTTAPVAFIYASEGVAKPVREALETDGCRVTMGFVGQFRSSTQFATFVEIYNPRVIVYEVEPPPECALKHVLTLKALNIVEGREFVLTTTDKDLLEGTSGGTRLVSMGAGGDVSDLRRAVRDALERTWAASERTEEAA